MSPRRPAVWDLGAVGLAVALAALSVHALSFLVEGWPAGIDAAARVIAYVLLPGWAAARRVPGRAGRGMWETGALAAGLGAALFGAAGVLARFTRASEEVLLLALAGLALVLLAPRPNDTPAAAPAPQESRGEARTLAHPAPSGPARTRTRT